MPMREILATVTGSLDDAIQRGCTGKWKALLDSETALAEWVAAPWQEAPQQAELSVAAYLDKAARIGAWHGAARGIAIGLLAGLVLGLMLMRVF
jgi:hypothetical protein